MRNKYNTWGKVRGTKKISANFTYINILISRPKVTKILKYKPW